MTYKQFIEDMRDQADFLEQLVKDSQVIDLKNEIGEDDTFLDVYKDGVEELIDNATGVHGHTAIWRPYRR
jgi:hypothetical protein